MVALKLARPTYPETGKSAFGKALRRFMLDKSFWPASLSRFFADLPESERRGDELTYSALLTWMAEETGISALVDPSRHKKYRTLLHRYAKWSYEPSESAGDDFTLLTAIALCGAACTEDGACITQPKELVDLLFTGQSDESSQAPKE